MNARLLTAVTLGSAVVVAAHLVPSIEAAGSALARAVEARSPLGAADDGVLGGADHGVLGGAGDGALGGAPPSEARRPGAAARDAGPSDAMAAGAMPAMLLPAVPREQVLSAVAGPRTDEPRGVEPLPAAVVAARSERAAASRSEKPAEVGLLALEPAP